MKRYLLAALLALAPAFARADTMPTIITPACGIAANGSTSQPLAAVGTLSASIARNPQTGTSYAFPASATCGAVTIRSNSGSAMTDTVPAAATYGVGFLWISNADSSATDTLSGGLSGVMGAGQNLLIVSDGSAWSQAGGSYFASASQARTNLGLGTAATQNTGTSGANVPLLNGANTWSAQQTFSSVPTLPNQSANQVYAGPSTGAAAAPGFRSLVGADLPTPTGTTLGGVQSATAPTNQFGTGINTSGVPTFAQPAFSNLSGLATLAQLPQLTAYAAYCNSTNALAAPVGCATVIHSRDYMVGNNSTDDTTGANNWITACQNTGYLCVVDNPPVCYKLTATVTITSQVRILGASGGGSQRPPAFCPTQTTTDVFQIAGAAASSTIISHIRLLPATAMTAGACIHVGTTSLVLLTVLEDVTLDANCWNGAFMDDAGAWVINRAGFNSQNYGLEVSQGGDSLVSNTVAIDGKAAAIAFLSSTNGGGGLYVLGGKFNTGNTGSTFFLIQPTGANASDVEIGHLSVEGYTNGVVLNKGSATTFGNVWVHDIEFSVGQCLTSDSNSGWLITLIFDQNSCQWNSAGPGASIGASTTNFDLKNNNFNGNGTSTQPAWSIASGASNGSVSGNHIYNDTAAPPWSNSSASTVISDNNGLPFAGLPSATANGSQVFVKDADPATSPCTSSGAKTGSTAFRQNGAWKCI